MYNEIKSHTGDPEMLEKLYRDDKKGFRTAFEKIYPEIADTEAARFWQVRLSYDSRPEMLKGFSLPELVRVIIPMVLVALLIKIPAFFSLAYTDEVFYFRNAALIVFAGLTFYTLSAAKILDPGKLIFTIIAFLVPAIYVNLLPAGASGPAINLVYIHLPLMIWFFFGYIYTGYDFSDLGKRISFIRYNGDLAIMYVLIAIAGGILTGITNGLFSSIGIDIEEFYAEYIIMTGAAAAPILATFLIEKYPALVSRTAPLIATIFSPMVLITLIIFLITMVLTGKDPYNDREFLLIFNIMLLGVMGIIIFSVTETAVLRNQKFNSAVLFALSVITIIIDLIALSAIFYRLGEYGLTPNRLAVLVSNVLVLINLILIMTDLFRITFRNSDFRIVELSTAKFLPVYLIWILIVVFGFPLIFGFN
jgi:hypothetical protein